VGWAIAVGALALAGPLAAMFALWRGAQLSLEQVLDARLRGAGESAALLLEDRPPAPEALRSLMAAQHLDGAYLLDRQLTVLADATGPSGARADLIRVDADRVAAAFSGEVTVASTYALGEVVVATGYFPVRSHGQVWAVLALEAGRAFADPGPWLSRALALGVLGALLVAAAIGVIGRRALQGQAAAARADAFARVAAMAAHEIRNPLGVIRGTVELMQARLKRTLTLKDAEALADVLGEVERLRRLTEDLTDLAQDRPLAEDEVDVASVLEEAARAAEKAAPPVKVKLELPGGALPRVRGDPARLRQVFANLLSNAAQSQREGEVEVRAFAEGGAVLALVRDRGPGVPPESREKLFDPFFTTRAQGSGLGLFISRRLVERHGGSLKLLDVEGPGACFEVRLSAMER